MSKLPLALTMGDPAGIGGELLAKAYLAEPALMAGSFVAGDLAHGAAGRQSPGAARRLFQLGPPPQHAPAQHGTGQSELRTGREGARRNVKYEKVCK
jgi:4-hydroxy-L-threonine phosphate dehydrogenase PdxA